jgi:hypothetical protein
VVNAADVATMEGNGTLDAVVLHEMGHVLGIGPLWQTKALVTGAGTADPRFTGLAAVAGYFGLGGVGQVPVDGTPAPVGSRDVHWRESVLGSELMTSLVSALPMPLSIVTVGSLADLGYAVDNLAADSYILSAAPMPAGAVTPAPAAGPWEILTTPTIVVDDRPPGAPK